jgi:crossover junction endodeoxyribonuclease RuvC
MDTLATGQTGEWARSVFTSACRATLEGSRLRAALTQLVSLRPWFATVAFVNFSVGRIQMGDQRVDLGVDPGIRGGLAIVVRENGVAPRLIDVIDIPTTGTGAKERVDAHAIHEWLRRHQPAHALIERAQAMPRQGASSGFKYGRAVGAIESAITLAGIPLEIIEPSVWKRALGLRGKDKELSRQRALQLFPAAHSLLARKKDHGRAEAALIALFGGRS